MNKTETLASLRQLSTSDEKEMVFKKDMIHFIEQNQDFTTRKNLKGHLTGSAWILNPDHDKVLLIHHKKLDLWLQPGGHIDEVDNSLYDTAYREAIEETGLKNIVPLSTHVFDIDIHNIPERKGIPSHFHYDIRYIFESESLETRPDFEEVLNIRWFSLRELSQNNKDSSLIRMIEKSLKQYS